jgi:hypothetical protein
MRPSVVVIAAMETVQNYFPLHEVSRSYEQLDFARDTRWVAFLKEYVIKVRRPNRTEYE